MITPAFTKLQRSIVGSSIWRADNETRLVWITLLAMCDRDGIVRLSPEGLIDFARVSREGGKKALAILQAPDEDSRDLTDGRRIERVPGGFKVLNYERVLGEGARESRREYNRQKKVEERARKKAAGTTVRKEHVEEAQKEVSEFAAAGYEASRWEECCCNAFRELINSGAPEPMHCPYCGTERPEKRG